MENITGNTMSLYSDDVLDRPSACPWLCITKAIILSLVVISIIIGNSLIITSVALYRKLRKSVSNSFIASLALADFMLGVVVLPFSLSNEIFGYWSFGDMMCQIWLVVDVWVCTASILHLCAISLDRYIAIAYPLKYPNLMTHRRCRIICLVMWVLSFAICFPGLIQGINGVVNVVTYNVTQNNTTNSTPRGTTEKSLTSLDECIVVSENLSIGYTIYSALGSFYIPSMVLIGFYIKIFLMATKFMSQARKGELSNMGNGQGGQTIRVHRGPSTKLSLYKNAKSLYEMSGMMTVEPKIAEAVCSNDQESYNLQTSTEDLNRNTLENTESSPAHSTLRKSSYKSDNHLLHSAKRTKHTAGSSNSMSGETRAAKTVAIIVGGFIICWTPFFVCYLVQGVSDVRVNSTLFNVFVWIGYVNSLINPCIYAYFSVDYRHAFKQILRCQLRRHHRHRKSGILSYISSLYVSSSSDRSNSITTRSQNLTQGYD